MRLAPLLAVTLLAGCVTLTKQSPPVSKMDAVRHATKQFDGSSDYFNFIALPVSKTKTEPALRYALFARTGRNIPALYGIQVWCTGNLDVSNATMRIASSTPLEVNGRTRVEAPDDRRIFNILEATFPGNYVEFAAMDGGSIEITTPGKTVAFSIPNWLFDALLEVAGGKGRFALMGNESTLYAQSNLIREQRQEIQRLYVENHAELSTEVKNVITEGGVVAGMTKDDVRASMGRPQYVIVADYFNKGGETWVYAGVKVTFMGGKVSNWELVDADSP